MSDIVTISFLYSEITKLTPRKIILEYLKLLCIFIRFLMQLQDEIVFIFLSGVIFLSYTYKSFLRLVHIYNDTVLELDWNEIHK